MAFIFVTFFAAGMALGQLGPSVHFNIPYAFTVGSKALPAGTYAFSFSNDFSSLTVESTASGSAVVNIIAPISGPNELFDGGYLVFDKSDSGLILSEAWLTGLRGALVHPIPNGDSSLGLIGTSLDMRRSYSGKTVYGLTCARCHGDNGKGNPEADKFYGLTIPRLSSAAVQGMSDAQIRLQITQGGSAMPPVEIEESGFKHRLPPQDVEAVIAYVRTLKQ
jgi:cytochrome c5